MGKINNKEVVEQFLNSNSARINNLVSDGKILLSYAYYVIGMRLNNNKYAVRVDQYSQSIACHIGHLIRGLKKRGYQKEYRVKDLFGSGISDNVFDIKLPNGKTGEFYVYSKKESGKK